MSYNQNIGSTTQHGVVRVGSGLSVNEGVISTTGSTKDIGSFFSTVTQTNALSINTVTLNTVSISQGVTLVSGSRLKVSNPGTYTISALIQFTKSNSSGPSALGNFWLRKNGINVADSASDVTTNENTSGVLTSWSYTLPLVTNDYLEIVWNSSASNAILVARPVTIGPPTIPLNPSVRATLIQI